MLAPFFVSAPLLGIRAQLEELPVLYRLLVRAAGGRPGWARGAVGPILASFPPH